MNKANECTCPSGDGSLVHPCPAHPAVEQACWDERKLSDLGNELHNLSCSIVHENEKLAEQIGGIARELWNWPQACAALAQPSPAHPAPVEQAGGDERDFQAKGAQEVPSPVSKEYDRHLIGLLRKGEALPGHQEEAADEIERLRDWNDHLNNTVLPNILNPNFLMLMKGGERLLDLCTKDGEFIGVSLNDMKDVFDWMVTHARIAPDQAALAQPSPKCATCGGTGMVDDGEITCSEGGIPYENGPVKCVKDCPDCKAQPSPAQAEQAEAERPEVVARVVHSNPVVLGQCGPLNANDELMTVAQHAASVARWAEMFNRVEQERDAALARVAELENGTVYVEARQCYECHHGGINDSADGLAACHDCDWTGPEPDEDKCPGCHRENCMAAACPECGGRYELVADANIAAPPAQAQHLHDLDKQCRDDVARALGLRPNEERGFAWSYLLASIKSCVKAAEDTAQAQHSVLELEQSRSALTEAQMRRIYENSTEAENERLGFAAFARLMRRAEAVHQIAAAPGRHTA
ncbi:hypothetical protein [Pseudomonas aeruginosa]|uniref:hypothetical protein n=1 Tax=Pseudomonas aeruginosa TaxID=287 RepID=UPI000AABA70E|nr:hypothetical protein [Pseudomonas aeruginosa]